MCEGWLIVSVIADRKIGKSAAPSEAGGEGPQQNFCPVGARVVLLYIVYNISEGWCIFFLSVIADRKIGKSAAPSGAGGEGPQKHYSIAAGMHAAQYPTVLRCQF